MDRIDKFTRCEVVGCNNLGDIERIKNNVVYRRKLCCSHKRELYNIWIPKGDLQQKLAIKGLKNKCVFCSWDGPCDTHRLFNGGRYTIDNIVCICPNCHRLLHRGVIKIDDYKDKILKFQDIYKSNWNEGTKKRYKSLKQEKVHEWEGSKEDT